MKKKAKFLFSFLLLSFNLFSQYPSVEFHHLSVEDGLSHAFVNAVVQDAYGFLWVGTDKGLNLYDGYEFKNYFHNPEDSLGLSDNSVKDLMIDSKNRLWIATNKGFQRFDYSSGNFITYLHEENNEKSLGNDYVSTLYESSNGEIWMGIWEGFSCFDPEKETFKNYNTYQDQEYVMESLVSCIIEDKNGILWMGTLGAGILKFDRTLDDYSVIKHDPEYSKSLSNNDVRTLFIDNENNFWVGTWGGGLSLFDPEQVTFKHYLHDPGNKFSISHNQVKGIIQDKEGNLWVGTEDGINRFDPVNERFFSYSYEPDNPKSMSRKVVQTLYQDRTGTIWIGTYNGGLNYFVNEEAKFRHYRFTKDNAVELQSNVITALYAPGEKSIWVGNEAGLSIFDRKTKKFTPVNLPQPDLAANPAFKGVSDVIEDAEGNVWIAYDGLVKIDKNGKLTSYKSQPGNWKKLISNNINQLTLDQKDNLWICTLEGLSYFDKKSGTFTNYKDKDISAGIGTKQIRNVIIDPENNIWVVLFGRILILDQSLNVIKSLKNNVFTSNPAIIGDHVNDILLIGNKQAWIATENGLQLLNYQTGENLKYYNHESGLLVDNVSRIIKDNSGNLWLGTKSGIVKFNPEKETFQTYLENGEMQSNILHCSLQLENGEMIFGGMNGFHVFHPDSVSSEKQNHELMVTEFQVYESSKPEEKTFQLLNLMKNQEALELNHRQKIFSLRFSTVNFFHADGLQYAYKLESDDNVKQAWKFVPENDREVTFVNVKPGKYNLHMKAVSRYGETLDEASLPVIISPPLWGADWFKLVLLGFAGVFIFVLLRFRTSKSKNEKNVLQSKMNEHEVEIKNKERLLKDTTSNLEETNKLLQSRQEKIIKQNEKIIEQKEALEKHQQQLEKQVKQRTEDLEKALIKAEESDKLKTAFLENLSHELRTPMNGILGFSTMITEKDITENERKDYLKIIQSSTTQLLTLIEDIVELSKLESRQMVVRESEFDLNTLMDEMYKTFMGEKIKREKDHLYLNLNKDFEGICLITSDEIRLRQILTYLLRNSIKFTMQGGVEFGYKLQEQQNLLFYVKDTGIGIRKEKQEIIFDRFRQVDDANSRQYGGTGLGLAISKGLLELFNGNIWVDSMPEKGSTFYFTIPFKPSNKKEYYEKVKDRARGGYDWENRTILIVEDELHNYTFLREALGPSKANLVHAANGIDAVEYCKNNEAIDMVLMDIKLPDISGLDATRQIREFRKELPIIAQTAYSLSRDREKCLAAGCNDYITKPIDRGKLFDKMKNLF